MNKNKSHFSANKSSKSVPPSLHHEINSRQLYNDDKFVLQTISRKDLHLGNEIKVKEHSLDTLHINKQNGNSYEDHDGDYDKRRKKRYYCGNRNIVQENEEQTKEMSTTLNKTELEKTRRFIPRLKHNPLL